MEQQPKTYMSSLEQEILALQAQGAALSLYALRNPDKDKIDPTQDDVKSELNGLYLTAFEYLAGISLEQPKQREVFGRLEEKISSAGTSLLDLLKGGEEQQIFLNEMYANSLTSVYGEGEKGAIKYVTSQMDAQRAVDSIIASNSDEFDKNTLEVVSYLSGAYKKMIAQQTMDIFGVLPEKVKPMLVHYSPANDNYAPAGDAKGNRDAA